MRYLNKILAATLVFALIGGLFGVFWYIAYAASAGPSFPTTAAYQNDGDGWSQVSNIEANDGKPAIGISISSGDSSTGSLYAEGFGFSIPTNATINGISASITERALADTPGTQTMQDFIIQLLKGGTLVGSNLATNTNQPVATTTVAYGGTTNLWGTTWTPSQINASNFGIDMNYEQGAFVGDTIYVDYVTLTITYTPATTPGGPSILTIKSQTIVRGQLIVR